MSRNKEAPYTPQLYLRVGEMIVNTATGLVGRVKRAITSQRYMIDYGERTEPTSVKNMQRYTGSGTLGTDTRLQQMGY